MENLKKFEEYMYRQSPDTKPERYEKSKEWFILKLVGLGEDKNELESLSLPELGKMYAQKKNK